jgi:4-hydroxy-3-polyprenylbenzoate decarboxylase
LVNLGSKLGIDATVKLKEEGFTREWQEVVKPDQNTEQLVDSKWKEYGITEESTD